MFAPAPGGEVVEDPYLVPAPSSRAARCEPMNPAPPVTSTRTLALVLDALNRRLGVRRRAGGVQLDPWRELEVELT